MISRTFFSYKNEAFCGLITVGLATSKILSQPPKFSSDFKRYVCVCLCVCVCAKKCIDFFNPQEFFQLEGRLYTLNENSYSGARSRTYDSLYADIPFVWQFSVRLRSIKSSLRKSRLLDG